MLFRSDGHGEQSDGHTKVADGEVHHKKLSWLQGGLLAIGHKQQDAIPHHREDTWAADVERKIEEGRERQRRTAGWFQRQLNVALENGAHQKDSITWRCGRRGGSLYSVF